MITLQANDMRLSLNPEIGGAIAAFTHRGAELLRPVADPRLGAQRGQAVAGYPLIPFANRIGNGRFGFGGQHYQLARNFGDDPNTIHGNAWMHAWDVAEATQDAARLVLVFRPEGALAAEWPFAYTAEQHFELNAERLRITISVRNDDARAAPAGIGLHPYVARSRETTLQFQADSLWSVGADGLPLSREAVHGAAEFADGRILGTQVIDTCYAGWAGEAIVTQPEDGLTLVLHATPPLDHMQLYTPAGRDFIGLEPVSNMPDAINRMDAVADQGMVVLPPGETLRGVVELGVRVQ